MYRRDSLDRLCLSVSSRFLGRRLASSRAASPMTDAFRLGRVLLGVTLGCACGFVSMAHAQNLGFLHDSPISFMKQKDMASLTTALDEALDKNADGQTSEWSNQGLGNPVPITGSITPKDALEDNGLNCRHLAVRLSARNQEQNWQPLYCKTAQGWKIQKR